MGTISQKLQYLNATKEAIAAALVEKGQTVSSSDTFRSYAEKVRNISTQPVLIEKTIVSNGTYNASDDDADGYSSVTVNIQAQYSYGSTTLMTMNNLIQTVAQTSASEVVS